jgi:uncharacterized membrane protein YbhN (UPF0104 family)
MAADRRAGSSGRALAVRAAGLAIAAATIAFCVRTLASSWSEVRGSLRSADPGWLVLALAGAAAAMIGLGLLWWRCLHAFGLRPGARSVLAWYFGGEFAKYLPGGVWAVLGRGELAQRAGGIARATAYATTLISYAVMCLAAAAVCGLLAPFAAVSGGVGWLWALALLLPAALALTHPALLGRALEGARRITRGRIDLRPVRWPTMVALVAISVPTWLLMGASAAAVTAALGLPQHPARVALAAVIAWIVGFLAVPVPAGAGVREVLFVVTCGLHPVPATTVAVVLRVLLVVVDAVGGMAGLAVAARRAGAARVPSEP